NVFFVNAEHRMNFKHMQQIFPVAYSDPEYQSACYISALPMLFYKFKDEIYDYDVPVRWIIKWLIKYVEKQHDESDQEYLERTQGEVNFDLTSSMQHLGK